MKEMNLSGRRQFKKDLYVRGNGRSRRGRDCAGGQSSKEGSMVEMSGEGDHLHLGLGEHQHTSGKEANNNFQMPVFVYF